MGIFTEEGEPSKAEMLADEQIRQNQQETELKRQNLYQTRLDIIKGQGGAIWTPYQVSPSQKGNKTKSQSNF